MKSVITAIQKLSVQNFERKCMKELSSIELLLKLKIVNLATGVAVFLKLFWDMCQFIIAMLYFV